MRETLSKQSIAMTRFPKLDHTSPSANGKEPYPTPLARIPRVDEAECVGCNLCSLVCPVEGCITMEEVDTRLPSQSWKNARGILQIRQGSAADGTAHSERHGRNGGKNLRGRIFWSREKPSRKFAAGIAPAPAYKTLDARPVCCSCRVELTPTHTSTCLSLRTTSSDDFETGTRAAAIAGLPRSSLADSAGRGTHMRELRHLVEKSQAKPALTMACT